MISSAKNMVRASHELCAGRALVRSPRQFALLAGASPIREEAEARLVKARAEIKALRQAVTASGRGEVHASEETGELITVLQGFAKAYRDLFRPVDDMLEDGFRVVSRLPMSKEYYEVLRGEALHVAAFRKFWNRISSDYRTIRDALCEYHGYEDIADQIETRGI
jgi:hypothetical protein